MTTTAQTYAAALSIPNMRTCRKHTTRASFCSLAFGDAAGHPHPTLH
ncbi:hypothetical protein FHT03_003817 [Xanthomonas arboricola]|nr:hypothetical protein [Xanthomonas cannabis]